MRKSGHVVNIADTGAAPDATARVGRVSLVGAGPGDPDLLTVKAHRLLRSARVVAYDELVADAILALAPEGAERIAVGRRANGCRHHDGRIHADVIARARAGIDVVRLKGGDPMIFGRGGEEAEALAEAGVPFEVVPGISAALGAAASAVVPLTHRDVASSVTFVTAHAATDDGDPKLALTVPLTGTLVFYMGLARLDRTARDLVALGRAWSTPVAIVANATRPEERVVVGTLADIAAKVDAQKLPAPALVIVGEVVARRVESPAAFEQLVRAAANG